MPGTHSKLAPSSAAIWMQCAASVRMQLPYQDQPPTEESLEGDAAHWVALMTCRCYAEPEAFEQGAINFPAVDDKAPNGVEVTQEMIDGAEVYADVVGTVAILETLVTISLIHPHCFGTPDARRREPRVLRVFDYKFGHRFVEVFNCWQLIAYVAGLLEEIPRTEWPDYVELVVVQPRCYTPEGPVRRYTYRTDDLVPLINRMHAQAALAVDESGNPRPDAPAVTGHECRDCKARHACTLFQSVAARIVDSAGRADLFELLPAQLGAELTYLDVTMQRLKARREGLAIQAETLLGRGQVVPGFAMESTPGNLSWNDDVSIDEVAMLGTELNVALCRDPEPVTPTQAKAILKRRAIDGALLEAYTHRPRGKMKLVQSTTTRAKKAFGASSK